MTGIYKIINLINNKVYIGQPVNIEKRWYGHKQDLIKQYHNNKHLQNAWNKYGENSFKFEVIEECNEEELNEREIYWIDYYGGCNSENTYNQRAGGLSGGKLSENTKEKISNTLKEKSYAHPVWNKGLTKETDERVAKNSQATSNYYKNGMSLEIRKKISKTVKQRWNEGIYNNVDHHSRNLGKKYKQRIDKGTKRSSEIGKNISEGKLKANELKRQKGLPIRNQIYPPRPMKISICQVCGKEFEQRQCHYKKTCNKECRDKLISIKNKERKVKKNE